MNRDDLIHLAEVSNMPYDIGNNEFYFLDKLALFAEFVIRDERKRLGLCPECAEPTRAIHTDYLSIETSFMACTECDWVGEPE